MRSKIPKISGQGGNIVGLVDIGTSKTVCLIVAMPKPRPNGVWRRESVRVLGIGRRPSRGLKAGVVIELDAAEQALRGAVTQAEQMAGVTIDEVFLSVTCGRLKSSTFAADTRIEGRIVEGADIERLMSAGRKYAERDGRTLLHMNHIAYRLDGAAGVTDPRGMAAATLAADLHAVTADDAPLRNLLHAVERAYLSVTGVAPAPYASGLAATTEEERRLGTICIDIGAGATTLSIFAEGRLLCVDTVAVGGNHVTFDVARALSTPFAEAERIKRLYGTVESGAADDQATVAYTLTGEEQPSLYQTTKAHIHGIVASRVSDLLGHVVERVERSGVAHFAAHRVVLTGGGSLLPGMSRLAGEILGRPARTAQVRALEGMPPDCCDPALSTVVGLVSVALDPAAGVRQRWQPGQTEEAGYLKRVGQWLRESF
jgi:cell division protein FtsA